MGGAKIELVLADNASGSAGTASEARRLITQEKVSFIAGPLVTSEMLALVPVLDEHKIPALSFTSGDSRSKYLYDRAALREGVCGATHRLPDLSG